MSDIISRREAIKSAKCIFESDSEMKAFCMIKMLEELPSISERDAVKLIWSAQVDDLIEKIKAESLGKWYTGRTDGKTDEVVLLKDVIEILEEAKG